MKAGLSALYYTRAHRLLAPYAQGAGLVFMLSCDAMRRLADAWRVARPSDRMILWTGKGICRSWAND